MSRGTYIDLTGQKFGHWTVIRRAENKISPNGKNSTRFRCRCECGEIRDVDAYKLKIGRWASCGCKRSRMIEIDGRSQSVSAWSNEFGIKRATVYSRARYRKISLRASILSLSAEAKSE